MNWSHIWKSVRNASPIVCTVIGITGVIGTAVLTAKGTPKALKLIEEKQEKTEEPLKLTEKALAAAPAYLPAAGVGLMTIAAIVSSNLLSRKQNLSLAATCTLLQRNFKDYKIKVQELFGEDANVSVEKAIAKERIDTAKIHVREHPTMDQLYIWYEPNSGQTFEATEADVVKAEMEVNKLIATTSSCSLYQYCQLLGIETPAGSENVGWDYQDFVDNWDPDGYWVDFYHEFIDTSDDDIDMPPYYVIHTPISPEWNFELEERPIPGRLSVDDNGCYAFDVR